ncbi:hypothetical protein [Hymenobacter cellulosilyticus]|uniref:Uncharacterized protein n=1 Tax=Hymenobacter cellulosilyticus TaxID=2932248 RepID=A0A8T9QCF3_9BACT|nr:hypothetical protein [Hymenobacter cellulosilyticus]UOQ75274.1 hypothetical protein MUN79_29220 [Hymenobacter cellulosilyticus]
MHVGPASTAAFKACITGSYENSYTEARKAYSGPCLGNEGQQGFLQALDSQV